jgi:hypothetical protein
MPSVVEQKKHLLSFINQGFRLNLALLSGNAASDGAASLPLRGGYLAFFLNPHCFAIAPFYFHSALCMQAPSASCGKRRSVRSVVPSPAGWLPCFLFKSALLRNCVLLFSFCALCASTQRFMRETPLRPERRPFPCGVAKGALYMNPEIQKPPCLYRVLSTVSFNICY